MKHTHIPLPVYLPDNFKRNTTLLLTCPREFLYSFALSTQKEIAINRYDPSVATFAMQLIKKLSVIVPGLTIQFIGSSALGVAGMSDIDLFIECISADFPLYMPLLTGMLGAPIKEKPAFIEWRTVWKEQKTSQSLRTTKARFERSIRSRVPTAKTRILP